MFHRTDSRGRTGNPGHKVTSLTSTGEAALINELFSLERQLAGVLLSGPQTSKLTGDAAKPKSLFPQINSRKVRAMPLTFHYK